MGSNILKRDLYVFYKRNELIKRQIFYHPSRNEGLHNSAVQKYHALLDASKNANGISRMEKSKD